MPKAAVLQGNFNSGELSPLLNGRTESPAYKKGLDTGFNYIPTLQGPLVRRPATKFMTTVKDSANPPVLIPFQFSITQAYILEFGDQYVRFYANNGQIVTSGTTYKITGQKYNMPVQGNSGNFYALRANATPNAGENIATSSTVGGSVTLELATPYLVADVGQIKYCQNADTLYLFHPNYPVYKLQRFAQTYWDLTQVYFQDGPYLAANTYKNFGDNVGVTLSPLATTTPLSEVVTGPIGTVVGAVADPVSGTGYVQIETSAAHGYVSGQKIYIEGIVGTTEANNYNPAVTSGSGNQYPNSPAGWSIRVDTTKKFVLIGCPFANAWVSGGTTAPALFYDDLEAQRTGGTKAGRFTGLGRAISLVIGGVRYFGTIDGAYPSTAHPSGFANASKIVITMGPSFGTPIAFPSTSAATAWYLGVFSGQTPNGSFPSSGFIGNGYPSCGSFHQNRLVMAGCPNYPQEVDGSVTSQFENFAASGAADLKVLDSSALQFTLSSDQSNPLQWLKSTAQALLAGSANAEWAMSPSSASDALTPTNFNAQQTSFYGSANADAVLMGNAALYIQRAQRKIREMNFFFQVGTFRSTDLTELSEHITNPGTTKIVVQKETQPILWALRSDGALLSMIYNRDDVSIQAGWTRHVLGGQSDSSGTQPIVQSMAIIPSTDLSFDQLWMTVKRYINGATIISIEYLTKIFDDLALQEDAFQGDCGGTYDLPKTITGITNASPAVVTSAAHGFSNGDYVRTVNVVGLGKTTTDADGNKTTTNLVNETTFVVAGVATDTFQLNDFNGNPIDSTSYGAYVSGGRVRKLVKTISGLTWLEGETVGVLTDGGIHPDCVVSGGGAITLNYPAAKVQVGYRFKSQGKLLRAEAGAADGTSIGKTRRTTRVAVQMHRIGDMSIGTSFDKLIPFDFSQADSQQADEFTPLYSGIIRDGVESSYDFEGQVCFEQSSMLPGSVQSITSFMEEQDV